MAQHVAHRKPRRAVVDSEADLLAALRSCLGRFATGVAVVTFDGPDGRHGLTINSFTSVSLRPPLILVSVARRARAHSALEGRPFCVNVLGAEQEWLAHRFAGGAPGPVVRWQDGDRASWLCGALAHLECTPWRAYDGGDHTLYLGHVERFEHREGDALGYHLSRFTRVAGPSFGHEDVI